MGVWDAISNGEVPSMDDVTESAGNAYDAGASAVSSAGTAIADGAGYVADGAADLADSAYHGLTDWHFEGRDARNNLDSPPDASELDAEHGWRQLPSSQSVLHQDETNDTEEAKFVHEDGRESVRYTDADGNLGEEVTRDDIRGTYNYVNPGDWEEDGVLEYGARMIGHFGADILPWMIGGSVRGDG